MTILAEFIFEILVTLFVVGSFTALGIFIAAHFERKEYRKQQKLKTIEQVIKAHPKEIRDIIAPKDNEWVVFFYNREAKIYSGSFPEFIEELGNDFLPSSNNNDNDSNK